MSIIPDVLEFNQQFVAEKQYEPYLTDKFPAKKVAILTCMDARLGELLLKALGFKNGDAKMIKNAGAIINQPFGSVMRSMLVAIYELQAKEILVIGHYGCGMTNLDTTRIISKFTENGIDPLVIETLENSGIRLEKFLRGFKTEEEGVLHSVKMLRKHPLIPRNVPIHGLMINPETGELKLLVQGSELDEDSQSDS